MEQKMNTLAVNRLLKRLEAAIASGNHQLASGLAKDLAKLKIQCSVVRQKKIKEHEIFNVDMYIEDRLAHQGPIPLQLESTMTISQLKEKIFNEFEIPVNVQRWIIGRKLADNNETTLEDLQLVEGLPIFLYLIAPVDNNKKKNIKLVNNKSSSSDEDNVNNVNKIKHVNIDKQIIQDKIITKDDINDKFGLNNKSDNEEKEKKEQEEKEEEEEGAVGLVDNIRMEQYNELIMLENCVLVPNTKSIECPICFMIYEAGEGVVLRDCLHTFCRGCIESTIRYCGEAEVKCPYMDSDYTCEATLQEREIKAIVDSQVYEKHLAKSVSQAENNAGHHAFHCKTPDCPGWCIYDDNVNSFNCPVCSKINCLTCQDVSLSKDTDKESKKTAAMLTDMLERGEAMSCPTCDVVLMKKWGCDWLRCSMCKTEICWVTKGPRWGPLGKGDTSGGCRCGENKIKCHPQCNYCH
ncbi:hypothetical protein HCN44_002301 [Aphidius gifuensis]|uniref:RanBP-type and C3HC4-type zinc finger-containing protein 1 n=1 Tax=Aphidius gifuensis TaxID=684658 RepID=A0A834Y2B5_APHGI|nr:hypothetical protein HCN44_002301 [Aphidius gifuensis]